MSLIEEYNNLMSLDFGDIKNSPNVLRFLKLYSTLYDCPNPRSCEAVMSKYYQELKLTGKMKAELHEEIKSRTCVPNWNGLRYINGDHYSDKYITDKQAFYLLMNGLLSENEFKVLPKDIMFFSLLKFIISENEFFSFIVLKISSSFIINLFF